MKKFLAKFARDEDGAALVEYGVALLVVIIVGAGGLIALSDQTELNFREATTAATPPAPPAEDG